MVTIPAGGKRQPAPRAKISGRHRAASIYGAIVTAAIIAATGGELSTAAVVIAVVVTLLVYWVAEEYAEVLGEQAEGGQLPTWATIRGMLASTWPMVSASYAPLLRMVGRAGGPVARAPACPCDLRRGRTGDRDDPAEGPDPHPPALTSTCTDVHPHRRRLSPPPRVMRLRGDCGTFAQCNSFRRRQARHAMTCPSATGRLSFGEGRPRWSRGRSSTAAPRRTS